MSSWIRLLEPATGNFRAVLHKGSPDGQTRTPSIWLMPSDNRLSVRVSTEKNPDIGQCEHWILSVQQNIFTYVVPLNYERIFRCGNHQCDSHQSMDVLDHRLQQPHKANGYSH